jgi:hypothetical protein
MRASSLRHGCATGTRPYDECRANTYGHEGGPCLALACAGAVSYQSSGRPMPQRQRQVCEIAAAQRADRKDTKVERFHTNRVRLGCVPLTDLAAQLPSPPTKT